MKKVLMNVLMIIVLVAGMLSLTGCTSGKSVTVKSENDEFSYQAKFKLSGNDEVTEYDEEDPESARIENEKENYVLDLYIDGEYASAYAEDKESAKEGNEKYAETKFGSYEGYTIDNDGDIQGIILLDSKDEYRNIYITFDLYLFDESAEKTDIDAIYKSETVQNILNKIEYKSAKK